MSSIFISHSKDKEIASRVLGRLRERGYRSLFLDFDPESGLKAGVAWERDLYRKLKMADAVVVLCSPSSMTSLWCFAEIALAKALGKAIFPLIIRPCEKIVDLLDDLQKLDLLELGEDEAFARLFDGLGAKGLDGSGSFQTDLNRPPFPGFHPFEEADAGVYCGREREVRRVIDALTSMQRLGEFHLAVIDGSSGSGKSSLVRAGVLPRLAKDPTRWAIIDPFRPRADPVGELARKLAKRFPDGLDGPNWKGLRERLKGETGSSEGATPVLVEVADDLTMALDHPEASVLIVVDQAEELIQGASPVETSAFLRVLVEATSRPSGRVFALLTIRSDFLGSLRDLAELRDVPIANLPLGLLAVERFPEVIEIPAARAGIEIQPGLILAMMADAKTDDALPLLAFTLEKLYERCKESGKFTIDAYRNDLGGIEGSVGGEVKRIRTSVASTPETDLALRRAFLKLASVNDEGRFIRQSARWDDLPKQAVPALQAFVDARLLTRHGELVEVSHESLFRVWDELERWLDKGRELILWKKNIRVEWRDWKAKGHSHDRLLRGARVAEARRWMGSDADEFQGTELDFLAASLAAEDERIERERAQVEHEKAQNARLRRLARGLAFAASIAALATVVSLGLWAYAGYRRDQEIIQRSLAEQQTRAVLARQLATDSRSLAETRPRLALLLAAEAVLATGRDHEPPAPVALDSLSRAIGRLGGIPAPPGEWSACVAVSPDGRWVVRGKYLRPLSAEGAADRPFVLDGHQDGIDSVRFSPDSRWLLTLTTGSPSDFVAAYLWDLRSPAPPGAGHRLYRWATRAPGETRPPVTIRDVGFSPEGRWLITRDTLWDLDLIAPETRPIPLPMAMGPVAFSPDGHWLAIASTRGHQPEDEGGWLWKLDGSGLDGDAIGLPGNSLEFLVFGRDSRRLITRRRGGPVTLLEVPDKTSRKLLNDGGDIPMLSLSPEGRWLAATGLWNLAADDPTVAAIKDLNSEKGTGFSPDGRWLLTRNTETVRLMDLRDFKPPTSPSIPLNLGPPPIVNDRLKEPGFAFSTDARWLATSGSPTRLWDLGVEDPSVSSVEVFRPPFTYVENLLAFSPDGRWLFTESQNFPLAPDLLLRVASRISLRNLTLEEWGKYLPPGREYQTTFDSSPGPYDADAIDADRSEKPRDLNRKAWDVVRSPGRSAEEYRRALRQASATSGARPDDPGLLNTLGVARYRAGQYAEAVEALSTCVSLRRESHRFDWDQVSAVDHAFLAMAYHQLSRGPEAAAHLETLRKRVANTMKITEEDRSFLREAEVLMKPPGPK